LPAAEWVWFTKAEDTRLLDPNFANAHHWFGLELSWLGREDEAIMHLRRAVEPR
jgi:hypothetical protein